MQPQNTSFLTKLFTKILGGSTPEDARKRIVILCTILLFISAGLWVRFLSERNFKPSVDIKKIDQSKIINPKAIDSANNSL